ncbi:Probable protein phosphatase 2C 73 (AtPP2C73) (AtPPC6, partial [Durusdinium trenchii]
SCVAHDPPQSDRAKETMKETSTYLKNRASVLFGRPSFHRTANAQEAGCFDSCFAAFLGYPNLSNSSTASYYPEKKALGPLPLPRQWAEIPSEKRGNIQIEVVSHAKETPKGWINQDSAMAVLPAGCSENGDGGGGVFLFGVFDGHGRMGHEASEIAASRMPGHLSNQPVHPSQNPGKALEGAFRNTDDDIFASMGADVEYSGSTGVVAMLDQGQRMLTMANVGDSRAVLGRLEGSTWCAIPLTTDLKPDLPEERERIELSGGTVCQFRDDEGVEAGPFRVWDGPACEKPGLAVSRSLGDGAARALGVTAIPVVTKHHLQPQDKFLIIATDGLWDSLDNQEVIRIVAKFQNMPSIALKALTEAVRRMEGDELSDDTTILLIRFA